MNIVSKIKTVGKITEKVVKVLDRVDVPEVVKSKTDFINADQTVHTLTRLNNELKATIEVAKRPFLDEIQKIDGETKDTRDAIATGIDTGKELMVKYFERFPNTELEAGTTMAIVKDLEIVDIAKVPEKYYEIAKAAILKDIAAGVKVPGVKINETYQVKITEKKY